MRKIHPAGEGDSLMRIPPYIVGRLRAAKKYMRSFDLLMYACWKFNICDSESQYYILKYICYSQYNGPKRRYRRYTSDERRQVINLYKQGYSIYEIAKMFNMPTSSVYYIVHNKFNMGLIYEPQSQR